MQKLLKVNNTRTCEICPKLTVKTLQKYGKFFSKSLKTLEYCVKTAQSKIKIKKQCAKSQLTAKLW